MSLMDLSLDAVIGITIPGNITVFFKGKMEIEFGRDSLEIASSSSEVIRGINSESSSIFCNDIMSILTNFSLDIVLF